MEVFFYEPSETAPGSAADLYHKCDVPVTGPHDLGKGFSAYLLTSPSGRTFVAEAESGGIVSDTLENARADVAAEHPADIRNRIRHALAWRDQAQAMPADLFWQQLEQLPHDP